MPSDTSPENSRPPTATGFGKVLNSIQGLQQRLDDFSIEEVSRAHAKAHSFIREMDGLRARLNGLAKLKDAVLSVNALIAAMPDDNFDLVGPDSLEKHPQLRAIVQAGKLIRMHRMLKAAQASAEFTSFDLQASLSSSDALPDIVSNPSPQSSGQNSTYPVTSANANTGISSEADQRSVVPEIAPVARDSKATPTYDFADLKLAETQRTVSFRKENSAQPEPEHTPSRKSKKPKGKPQIDQRLLSDLIETYGEFAISSKPAAPVESIATPSATVLEAPATSTALVPFASTSAAPAFLQPVGKSELLGLPASEQEREEPVFDGPSPSIKSRGEIDRQLKSIIKDYGEVDLYSHGKTLNVKTAVIAAATGLALLLGGFYLVKAPSSSAPPAVEATAPQGSTSSYVREQPSKGK